jgi:hypothetical protein
MSDKSDRPDVRSRYATPIEEAFEAASKLAGGALPPTPIYENIHKRTQ